MGTAPKGRFIFFKGTWLHISCCNFQSLKTYAALIVVRIYRHFRKDYIDTVDEEVVLQQSHERPHYERDEEVHVQRIARTVQLPVNVDGFFFKYYKNCLVKMNAE